MTLTPFMILILACYALFIGVLAVVSIWSNGGARQSTKAKAKSEPEVAGAASTILT